jgi:hypothetical protein
MVRPSDMADVDQSAGEAAARCLLNRSEQVKMPFGEETIALTKKIFLFRTRLGLVYEGASIGSEGYGDFKGLQLRPGGAGVAETRAPVRTCR